MSRKKKDWKTEKDRVLNMSLEERRKEYRRSEYVPLDQINTWKQSQSTEEEEEGKDLLRDKVSLYKGDITILEVDAIVNAGTVLCYYYICLIQEFVKLWLLARHFAVFALL
uniref:Macro domain-containing protein n=1 Tax=Hucho hucho TaxID=62062 RepID=A0A4W5LNL4_9TELE